MRLEMKAQYRIRRDACICGPGLRLDLGNNSKTSIKGQK
jgi:hypothetical protein